MSVIVSKRGKQDLQVLNSATELAAYTVNICANEKSFPKKYRWPITNQIVSEAIKISAQIRKANHMSLYNDIARQKRYEYQMEANASCESLLCLIDIAYKVFHFSSDRLEYWVGLTVQVEEDLKKWCDSDKRRIAKHKQ